MGKSLSIFFSFILFTFLLSGHVSAAAPSASASFSKKANSVSAFFSNLKGVKSVSYTLSYTGSGISQGVVGSIKPGKAKSASRKLYLGTCSGRVCVAHRNVKNLKLKATFNAGGKTTTKTVKIK